MRFIRWIIGKIILFLDWATSPRGIERPSDKQQAIDAETAAMALYQFEACPFCVKVRRTMKRQSLQIELKDAKRDPRARQELLDGGGKVKVPCLRIEDEQHKVQWLYESSEIVRYLNDRFAA